MAGKIMHAFCYEGYGGGADALKVCLYSEKSIFSHIILCKLLLLIALKSEKEKGKLNA
jgi:hypothetical protein